MFEKIRNTAIRESFNIESLLLWIERFQLRCNIQSNKYEFSVMAAYFASLYGKNDTF